MDPKPLLSYTRKCYRSNCNGTITVTKVLGQHIWLDTIFNNQTKEKDITCTLKIYFTKLNEITTIRKIKNYI